MSDPTSSERERVIAYFEQIGSDDRSAYQVERPRVKDRSLRKLLEDFDEYIQVLPVHPRDAHGAVAKVAATRAIEFLRSGREYEYEKWNVFGVMLLGGFVVTVVGVILAQCDVVWGGWVAKVGIGIALTPLFVVCAFVLFVSGIHIFRVRVLRHDRSEIMEEDYWPFAAQADWQDARHD